MRYPLEETRTDHVLLVEDNHRLEEMLANLLVGAGCMTDTVASAAEARLRLFNFVPDLVVVDLALPGGEGYELVSMIRSNPLTRGVPVIGLTVASTFGEGNRALATGMTRFLTGPLDPDTFGDQVRASLQLGNWWKASAQ